MKKFSIILVAAIMVLALTMPAAAFENEFGGFFRTRAYSNWNFTGTDGPNTAAPVTTFALNPRTGVVDRTVTPGNKPNRDIEQIDTRTRLYYTAKFSDNLKFVNKFEMNATWGGQGSYGQLAADGANFVVKHSYVDFKLAEQRFTVGVQDFTLARGYLFDDDAAGIKAIFKVNDAIYLPLIYLKIYEGGQGWVVGNPNNVSTNADNFDVDAYIFYPSIFLSKSHVLKPHVAYLTSENYNRFTTKGLTNAQLNSLAWLEPTKLGLWTAGLEYDGKADIFSFGATGIFEFGSTNINRAKDFTVNPVTGVRSQNYGHDHVNFSGYLFDLRGGVDLGPANVHLKGIYASGDGKGDALRTAEAHGFLVPGVSNAVGGNINNFQQSNWAEIMGCGMFDYQFPSGALGTQITNAWIAGLGGSYKLLQDLQFSADLWWAMAADSITTYYNANGSPQYTDLYGTELDLKATYTIVDNLKLDLVGAYLWAGDVITKSNYTPGYQGAAANPIELGAQLSLAF